MFNLPSRTAEHSGQPQWTPWVTLRKRPGVGDGVLSQSVTPGHPSGLLLPHVPNGIAQSVRNAPMSENCDSQVPIRAVGRLSHSPEINQMGSWWSRSEEIPATSGSQSMPVPPLCMVARGLVVNASVTCFALHLAQAPVHDGPNGNRACRFAPL